MCKHFIIVILIVDKITPRVSVDLSKLPSEGSLGEYNLNKKHNYKHSKICETT